MFRFVERKSLFLGAIIALVLLVAKGALAEGSGQLVCLDPGHGGNSGAQNPKYDLWEDEINLDVTYRVKALLEGSGYTTTMTRETNAEDPSNNDRYTLCNNAVADILVSIHTNSSTNKDIDGSLAQYFHKDDRVLAKAILDEVYPVLNNVSWPFTNFGLERFASGVLLKSDMPAATMEPVMMSYDLEAEQLATPIYLDNGVTFNENCVNCRREQIAQSIYRGIEAYFASNPGDGEGGGNGGGGKPCPSPPCKK